MGRLLVPLKTEFFEMFKDGEKEWEFRGISTRFNRDTVRPGRNVELSRGYSGESVEGTIEKVIVADSFHDLPEEIQDSTVPRKDKVYRNFIDSYQEKYDEFIAFKIKTKD